MYRSSPSPGILATKKIQFWLMCMTFSFIPLQDWTDLLNFTFGLVANFESMMYWGVQNVYCNCVFFVFVYCASCICDLVVIMSLCARVLFSLCIFSISSVEYLSCVSSICPASICWAVFVTGRFGAARRALWFDLLTKSLYLYFYICICICPVCVQYLSSEYLWQAGLVQWGEPSDLT